MVIMVMDGKKVVDHWSMKDMMKSALMMKFTRLPMAAVVMRCRVHPLHHQGQ
jgi:hypothetical protein